MRAHTTYCVSPYLSAIRVTDEAWSLISRPGRWDLQKNKKEEMPRAALKSGRSGLCCWASKAYYDDIIWASGIIWADKKMYLIFHQSKQFRWVMLSQSMG